MSAPSLLIVATVSSTIDGFLLPYAAQLRSLGWRVEAAANGAALDPGLRGAFDAVHEIPLSRSVADVGGMARSLRSLSRILDGGFDIVHVHTPIAAVVARVAVRLMPKQRRASVVYTAHGFHFHSQGGRVGNFMYLSIEKLTGLITDRLVVINEEDAAAALRYHIVPRPHLVTMRGIGVDTSFYARDQVRDSQVDEVRRGLDLARDVPLFVVVGELNKNKRPTDAVEALATMRHASAHLMFLGRGPQSVDVEAVARANGISSRVHLMGPVADVRPYIMASSALILASQREGLPRSIMEAMALQVPVICSAARGSRELVRDDAGFVVPIGDVTALSAAMDRIVEDPDGASQMGERGRSRITRQYELRDLIEQHEKLYLGLLAERGQQG